jgi:3-isopropylmalate/(R)-2-methylmalate dehydratase small subunit
MEAFRTHTGIGVPLRRSNVDTDQIIPAVYLKRVTRTGFEDGLFAAWRNDPSFILNLSPFDRGSVLVAGPDFGTGSSREHAVWALMDYGWQPKSPRTMSNCSGSSSSRIRGWKSLWTFKIGISPPERRWCRSRLTITPPGDCSKASTI